MKKKTEAVAVLFGRKGSSGFPGKNFHPVLGRPALLYPLMAAKYSKNIDSIFVSTNDPQIEALSISFKVSLISRPPELCTKDAFLEDAIQHAYFNIKESLGHPPDYVVILMCNACNIVSDAIDQGLAILESRPDFDSAITVCRYNMFAPLRARKLVEDGSLKPIVPFEIFGDEGKLTCDRQSTGDVYFADGGATVVRGECLEDISRGLLPFRWMGRQIHPIIQESGGGDIDEPWQVAAVETWLRRQGFTDISTPYDKK
jgi:CMP-N-acetylneuraminic acid synthetase